MLSQNVKRYIPQFVWIVVVFTIIVIPLKIIGYGFLPMDDALRHAAKAVSGKTWQQILVMRDDFQIDPSPGWQAILSWIHNWQNCSAETLVVFSVVTLMLLVTLSALPWLRRPEAWLAALFAAAIFIPACTTRFARGRPYLLTDAVLIALLFLWSRLENDRPRRMALIFTPPACRCVRVDSRLVVFAVFAGGGNLVRRMLAFAFWYGGCWLAGSFLGCALTGHPIDFLLQSVRHMFGVFGNFAVIHQLEPEMYPSDGETSAVLAVVVLILCRKMFPARNPRTLLNPVFVMMVLGWLLGLKMRRFWWDFGTPAFMVWVAMELQEHFENHLSLDSARRLLVTLGIAAGAFLGFTSDRESRWTASLTTEFVSLETPGIADWLPEPGGIIYNSDMDVFFQTFYKNPTADWRYILGFESGLMRPDDLETLRKIQWNRGAAFAAYEPWVKKMRPADRMILRGSGGSPPGIPELEWHYAVTGLWIGRLPKSSTADGTPK